MAFYYLLFIYVDSRQNALPNRYKHSIIRGHFNLLPDVTLLLARTQKWWEGGGFDRNTKVVCRQHLHRKKIQKLLKLSIIVQNTIYPKKKTQILCTVLLKRRLFILCHFITIKEQSHCQINRIFKLQCQNKEYCL